MLSHSPFFHFMSIFTLDTRPEQMECAWVSVLLGRHILDVCAVPQSVFPLIIPLPSCLDEGYCFESLCKLSDSVDAFMTLTSLCPTHEPSAAGVVKRGWHPATSGKNKSKRPHHLAVVAMAEFWVFREVIYWSKHP